VQIDKPFVVTAGEPAGIGPELCLALAHEILPAEFIVVGDPDTLRSRAEQTGIATTIIEVELNDFGTTHANPGELLVAAERFPVQAQCGKPDPANAEALLNGLRFAVNGCIDGKFAGLITAPLQKSVINDAGIVFTGHTEFLAELTGTALPVMLLVAGDLRVALASTHMPLRDVPDYITRDGLRDILQVLIADLQSKFRIEEPEIKVRGPLPADTAFTPVAGHKDAVLAMYHDQGLPVLKYAGFGRSVNVTLGLPIVRTSVDHGTALDIAGTGKADSGSLIAAVKLATELANR